MSTGLGIERKTESADPLGGRRIRWDRYLTTAVVVAAILAFIAFYYKWTYVGLLSRDAIDTAQVAANISLGRGFTTRFVRPFNAMYFEAFQGTYPEINHAPLFPYIVALMFKLRAVSEQVVMWASLLFAVLTAAATYALGRLLFEHRVGLLAAAVFILSRPVLNAALSGEEWMLCAFLFTILLLVLAAHHRFSERGRVGVACACLSAALLAALYMTNHILVFLVIPTAIYFGVTGPRRRMHLAVFLAACIVACSPWAIRNMAITGIPVLGVTGWDMLRDTRAFPGDTFSRSVSVTTPGLTKLLLFPMDRFPAFADKLMRGGSRLMLDMMSFIGYFASAFAVVGMLYRFRSSSANAVRGYIYGALPLMLICFAVFSVDSPALVIFGPVASVLACAYLLLLLDAKKLHPFFTRLLIGGLVFLTAIPAVVGAIWVGRKPQPEGSDELGMLLSHPVFLDNASRTPVYTDIPWTVAWKTSCVAVWLPVSDSDCRILSGMSLPLNMVLLTPECEGFAPDEIWRALHSVRVWRDYVQNPDRGVQAILREAGVAPERVPYAGVVFDRMLRRFQASEAMRGFTAVRQDPLQPDYVQLLVRTEGN